MIRCWKWKTTLLSNLQTLKTAGNGFWTLEGKIIKWDSNLVLPISGVHFHFKSNEIGFSQWYLNKELYSWLSERFVKRKSIRIWIVNECLNGNSLITAIILTCPKGFGLKLAKLGLTIPLKNKVKQKQSKAEPS